MSAARSSDGGDPGAPGDAFVVVPHRPGPFVVPEESNARDRDELDHLVDDLFPEIDDPPGWFDAGLTAVGLGLLAWAFIGEGPRIAAVLGVVAVSLAIVLPVRAAWRWLQGRSRHRRTSARLAAGVALDVSSPAVARLVAPYRSLFDATSATDPALADPARSVAHAAVTEVATLLDGRTPRTDGELRYVDERAAALTALLAELRARSDDGTTTAAPEEASAADPDLVVAAREELDQLSSTGSVARIEQLTEEARQHREG